MKLLAHLMRTLTALWYGNRPLDRPRLKLLHYDRPSSKTHKYHHIIIQEPDLKTFPEQKIEANFNVVINQDPTFSVVLVRYLAGYFLAQSKGFENPASDIIAMWEFHDRSPHPHRVCVFYVDDTYYAGDIIYGRGQQWTIRNTIKYPSSTFYIRLLYKINTTT